MHETAEVTNIHKLRSSEQSCAYTAAKQTNTLNINIKRWNTYQAHTLLALRLFLQHYSVQRRQLTSRSSKLQVNGRSV